MNLIINPIGISILNKLLKRKTMNELEQSNDEEIKKIKKDITNKIPNIELSLQDLSVETNSISKMEELNIINPKNDVIYLLYTDTIAGKLSAEVINKVLIDKLGFMENKINLEKLEGIKIDDAESFISGASNLNDFLFDLIKRRNDNDEIIINITGGFKAVTPALTMFCRFLDDSNIKSKLCYLYEHSKKLIQFKIENYKVSPLIPKNRMNDLNPEIRGER